MLSVLRANNRRMNNRTYHTSFLTLTSFPTLRRLEPYSEFISGVSWNLFVLILHCFDNNPVLTQE